MIVAPSISARPQGDPILDWAGLVDEGRAKLAAMSDGRWTDFNTHDPGITILELVAYALLDLGFRARHPMADLTAGAPALPGPAASLSTRAVTLADLRRLGLDVPGARNVWIEPADGPGIRLRFAAGARDLGFDDGKGDGGGEAGHDGTEPVRLAGVHRVIIEKSSREDLASADVARAVALRLHAERNLGEDFDGFAVLDPQAVVVAADLEIDDPAQADAILLVILARLEAYLSPQPARRTVAARRAAGDASDLIYDGPLLQQGLIATPADPGGRRRILHLSDIIAELTQVSGVRATRRVRLGTSLAEADSGLVWSLAIGADRVPGFDVRGSRIRLLSGGAVALDSTLRPDLAQRFAESLRVDTAPSGAMDDPPPPRGRDRRVADYRPLRLDLPMLYGVRPGSLGRDATPERRAKANQLRAYLALFDALLANSFAQLSGAAALLAADPGDGRSYFTQHPEPPSDEDPILAAGLDSAALQAMVEDPDGPDAAARRNRFLGHLLARHAETVPSLPRPLGGRLADAQVSEPAHIAAARLGFLKDFASLSAGRGSGANLLVDGTDSPLVARIRLKLGVPVEAAGRLLLIEHILLRGIGDDVAAALPILAAAARADPFSLQISFVFDDRLAALPGEREAVARIVREETPAHLVAYVHWLAPAAFDSLTEAHGRWLTALRRHRREALGIAEPTQ